MSKIVVLIISDDHIYHGGRKTSASIAYFNPNIKIIIYGTKEINALKEKFNCNDIRFIGPLAIKEVWYNENPDLLIKVGSDCLCLGNIEDLVNLDFDVAAARNDCDVVGDRDESNNRPDIIRDIPNHLWVNADFICFKNSKVVDAYQEQILNYWTGKDKCLSLYRQYSGDCQSAINVVFRLGGFKTLILDPKGSNIIYGASGNWTGETDNECPDSIDDKCNNFKSWKYIYLNDKGESIMPGLGEFKYGNRKVVCLHQIGGFHPNKLAFDLFNTEFRKYLEKITGFKE